MHLFSRYNCQMRLISTSTLLVFSNSFARRSYSRQFSVLFAKQYQQSSFATVNSLLYHPTTNSVSSRKLSKMVSFEANIPDLSDAPTNILRYTEDRYDGAIVDFKQLPSNDGDFTAALDASLAYWRANKKRGIWMKLPIQNASFIPIATARGFVFHHAENNYVMMTHWLGDGESRLPQNASHQVGVGSVVIDDTGRLLLVQEKNGPLKGAGVWKLPTGLSDPGEDIADAAMREVLEETGVKTEFVKLLCFRQAHNILFGKSDLFFVCVLRPLTKEVTHQEIELVAADWCTPETLFDQAFFQRSPFYSVVNQLIRDEIAATHHRTIRAPASMTMLKMPIGFRPGEHSLYYVHGEDTSIVIPESVVKNSRDNATAK